MSVAVTFEDKLAFPSMFIGAADLKGKDATITIVGVQQDELRMAGGGKKKKFVVYMRGTDKMFVLNKTNAIVIAAMHGPEMKHWIGRRITLYPTTTKMGAQTVPCVRVREAIPPDPQPVAAKPAAIVAPPPQQVDDVPFGHDVPAYLDEPVEAA